MSITLIHGDNQVESRNSLHELINTAKQNDIEIIRVDGNNLTLNEIVQALEAQSLFSNEKLVVIENLFSARKDNNEIINYLKPGNFDAKLVIWEPKKIDGRKITWIKNKQEFSYPQVLFKFLESIGSQMKENTLKLFNEVVKTQPVELVYYMIVRQFRLLLLVKSDATNARIKETSRLQPWQISRLKRQSASIGLEDLLKYYKTLMHIDYQQKTGRAALDLKQTLDIFLTKL